MSKEKTNYQLAVETRSDRGTGAMRRARKVGKIPAVVYSRGAETQPLFVDAKEWDSIRKHDFNLVTLLEGKKKIVAVVKEVQNNYLKSFVVHIDFQEVKMDEKITAAIPVSASMGEPVGVSKGGILEQAIHEIDVNCLPGDLPEAFEADISALEIGDSLHVSDIVLPEKVELISDPKLVIFQVNQPLEEEEPEAVETEEGAEGEEGAEEGEAGEGAEAADVAGEKKATKE
jgi:large subunit ribosomal protein L25